MVVLECFQDRAGYEAIVSMVRDHADAHPAHDTIEKMGCSSFEAGIRAAVIADTIHDITSLPIMLQHLRDDGDVILQVGI